MKKTILPFIIAVSSQLFGQTTFQKTYTLDGFDIARSFAPTADGGFCATGSCLRIGDSHDQIYFLRTDSNSNILASNSYGSAHEYRPGNCIKQCSDGGFIIAGSNQDFGTGSYYVFLMRTNPIGQISWFKLFKDVYNDQGYSVTQTTDSGFIVVGSSFNSSTFNSNIYIIRTDNNGDSLWTKIIDASSDSYGYSVHQTFDGGFIIAGQINSYASLLKISSSGTILWAKSFINYLGGNGYCVQQTSDSGFIMTGYLQDSATYNPKFFLVRTNYAGDTLWTKKFGGSADEMANSVSQTSDNGFIVAGFTTSFGVMDKDFYLIRTNSIGDTLWTKTYGDSFEEIAYSVFQTTDGGFLTGGYAQIQGGYTAYVIKTDSMGNSGCNERHTQTSVSCPQFTVFTPSMNSTSGSTDSSIYFSKIPGGIANLICGTVDISEIKHRQSEITIFPNPFKNTLGINNLALTEGGEILLSDIYGKEIFFQRNIDSETIINTENLAPGFYFLHYLDKKTRITFKVIKL